MTGVLVRKANKKRDTPRGLGSAKTSVFIEAQGGLLLNKYTQGFEEEMRGIRIGDLGGRS